MEQFRPEANEINNKSLQDEVTQAEVKLRSFERSQQIKEFEAKNQTAEQIPSSSIEKLRPSEVRTDRDVTIFGDPVGDCAFNHPQGANDLGFQGDCGIVSCQDVLNQHGINVTENDVVKFADQNNLCYNDKGQDAALLGGTLPEQQRQILDRYGISSQVKNGSIESLAQDVRQGKSVIIEVNADQFWKTNDPYDAGIADHAVVVTGVEYDTQTGRLNGFYVNDSGDGLSGKFIDAETMQDAWLNAKGAFGHGTCVVTDAARPRKA